MIRAAIVYRKENKYLMITAPVGCYRYSAIKMRRGLMFSVSFRGANIIITYDLTPYHLIDMNQESIVFVDRMKVKHRMFIPLK